MPCRLPRSLIAAQILPHAVKLSLLNKRLGDKELHQLSSRRHMAAVGSSYTGQDTVRNRISHEVIGVAKRLSLSTFIAIQ